jgi:pyruvate dehydrogenase E2 component (dihydrolipoamide acetyltransferase)
MSVSVSMPQLGESVTEGTVTRWLKKEGERVEADEPLLEVSTDKVDTEIPSPVSGVLRGITVAEDETVAVGAELAVIDEEGAAASTPAAAPEAPAPPAAEEAPAAGEAPAAQAPAAQAPDAQAPAAQAPAAQAPPAQAPPAQAPAAQAAAAQAPAPAAPAPAAQAPAAPATSAQAPAAQAPAAANGGAQGYSTSAYQQPYQQQAPPPATAYLPQPPQQQPPQQQPADAPAALQEQPAPQPSAPAPAAAPQEQAPSQPADGTQEADGVGPQFTSGAEGPYVTPLVRKLAAEHEIDLGTVTGTGVGGRIRKQDVLDAARARRGPQEAQPAAVPQQAGAPAGAPQQAAPAAAPPSAPAASPAAAPSASTSAAADSGRPAIVPSSLRGTTEKLSRSRQVIAQRMVESLQTSAQLTTVVEADVTAIARLRDRAKAAFEAREGVKLSFLPFFALATVEALKVHPKLNAIIDTASAQVTYHDAEHLGIAVDTERGLMVPVIRKAGDLNIAGLARKIADLAARTRAGQVSPDELSGGTFTLTNTGSRGALFDTPIINQPQVGILGTGTVVKRAVVVEDPALGEVIAVRSMVYLALTYDHRLVDGADAARFLVTIKERLEEGAFETELGL